MNNRLRRITPGDRQMTPPVYLAWISAPSLPRIFIFLQNTTRQGAGRRVFSLHETA